MSYWKNALCTHVQGGRGGAPKSEHVRTEGDRGSKKRCLSAYVFYGCSHDEQKELRNMIRNSYSV